MSLPWVLHVIHPGFSLSLQVSLDHLDHLDHLDFQATAMALPTRGRVIIDTTAGEIDVELWSKVCAKQLQAASYQWLHV